MVEELKENNELDSSALCKSCGLCCTGHLFISAELYRAEVEASQALGLTVLRDESVQPVFKQPCPLWKKQCTIYSHPLKPSICSDFRCKLLRELEEEQLQLDQALAVVQKAKELIQELGSHLPAQPAANFRHQLFEHVNQLEQATFHTEAENNFRLKAGVLLVLFAQRFGVTGLFNKPNQEITNPDLIRG